MNNKLLVYIAAGLIATGLPSCKKDEKTYNTVFPNATGTDGALKDATDMNVGVAVNYTLLGDAKYVTTVKSEFDGLTMENSMKNAVLVNDDGTFNFTEADAIINTFPNMVIFGHTLAWHEQQSAAFISKAAGLVASSGPNIALNGGFELGGANNFTNYGVWNSNGATISVGSGPNEIRTGSRSMKVVNPTAFGGDQWKVQIAGDLIPTTPGAKYEIKYYVKSLTGSGSIRLSTNTNAGGTPQYQGDQNVGSDWAPVTWQIVANSTQTRWVFDMGRKADTYLVDDVTITAVTEANADPVAVGKKADSLLKYCITGIVNHFKPKVKSWDVVNEVIADNGEIRSKANTPRAGSNAFIWSNYLGKNFGLNAFKYAKEADPSAILYINDYGLETNSTKLDSLISYVKWLKANGAQVDGIGTQMHITFTTRHQEIDDMMKKLAATGLKVRISELDVRVNPTNVKPYVLSNLDLYGQEQMYKYVIGSYRKYVPPAQQGGITIWGLTDDKSWLYKAGIDYPLLFNANYSKKSTYAAALAAFK